MENKKVFLIALMVVLGMISMSTGYKIYKNHQSDLIKVVEREFSFNARNCFNSGKCDSKKVYLKDLYEKGFLEEKLTNPINKKYYLENSYIDLKTKEIKLIS